MSLVDELSWLQRRRRHANAVYLGREMERGLLKTLSALDIDDRLARDIEWVMHRPLGWLDEDHRGEALER
jgi:hypothetical protein